MEKRYGVLRAIGGLYQILAVLVIIGTILAALALRSASQDSGNFGVATSSYSMWIALAVGITSAVSLFATGEAIFVFLGIEENTRRQAIATERWVPSSTPIAPPSIVEPPAQP